MKKENYRIEGVKIINKLFPRYNLDARVYDKSEDFKESDYPLKKGERLMIRVSGSNDPTKRNPDRIVKSTQEIIEFMDRWKDRKRGKFIVQRYPNEKDIAYSASGVIDCNHPTPLFTIEIRQIPEGFIEMNMKTDIRDTTTRDAPLLVTMQYDFCSKMPKKSPANFPTGQFKKSITDLWVFADTLDSYLLKKYDRFTIRPYFLTVILKNGKIFPVDVKRKYDVKIPK